MSGMTDKSKAPKKRVYANDGSFESIVDTARSLANKVYASRVLPLSIPMTEEDVFQELCVIYLKCKETWSPDRGVKFNTYFTSACYYDINKVVERNGREFVKLGLMNSSALQSAQHDDSGSPDIVESTSSESFYGDSVSTMTSPDELLEARQSVRSAFKMVKASDGLTKKYLTELLLAESNGVELPKLADFIKLQGLTSSQVNFLRTNLREIQNGRRPRREGERFNKSLALEPERCEELSSEGDN